MAASNGWYRTGARTTLGRTPPPAESPDVPGDPGGRRFRFRPTLLLAAAAPVAAVALLPTAGTLGADLPAAAIDLSLSFTRMLLAYLLSLVFSIVYGYYAATHRPAERVLIPVLDILQSVPILGFFPIAIGVLLLVFPPPAFPSWFGPNVAAIFLIFTSMAWNMVFGVYESIRALPQEMREAADSFGLRGRLRFRAVLIPATINRLVYNSILSWTAGWYFLVAAEIFSLNSRTTTLPGIGSYLLAAAAEKNVPALLAGLLLLVALITALDLLLWRPLTRWADRFRYDQAPSGTGVPEILVRPAGGRPIRRAAGVVVEYVRSGVSRVGTPIVQFGSSISQFGSAITERTRRGTESEFARTAFRYVAIGALLTIGWLILITIGVGVYSVFRAPIPAQIRDQIALLPEAVLLSLGRVTSAYLISLAIALPLAIFLTQRPKVARYGMPAIEVVASIPATALFPLFIFALVGGLGATIGPQAAVQTAAILMLTTGMLWYLFFNILSGLRSIPPDLDEAARSFGLTRRQYYLRLVFPAIFPAFITGSITAFGGGWNALIIAEYINYSPTQYYHVLGVGSLIDMGTFPPHGLNGLPLLASAVLVLVLVVVVLNELLWKPLYRRAAERYRIE